MTSAFEASPVSSAARIRILPAGEFRARDGRPEGLKAWVITAQIANRLIQERARNPEAGLIDYEHQSLTEAASGTVAPAAGWFRTLDWVEGEGLFMSGITWTPQASRMILDMETRYISPLFYFDAVTGEVLSIVSVALVKRPALIGLSDLAAASAMPPAGHLRLAAGVSAEDAAKIKHLLGGPVSAAADLRARLEASIAESGGRVSLVGTMSEADREKFVRVFGDVLGLPEGKQ